MVHRKKKLSKKLGIGKSNIYQSIVHYKRSNIILSPKMAKRLSIINLKVDHVYKQLIKQKVYQFWIDQEFPTLDKILKVVNEDEGLPFFSRISLYRLLISMNFEYVKKGRNIVMVEKSSIVLWRKKYLRQIRQYREEGRPIYYLAETGIVIGRNQRSPIIFNCHIASEDGIVPGSHFSVELKKNTNGNTLIDGECYRQWLESVLPKLKDQAVIIGNNKYYRSMKQDNFPTINSRKADIIQWLSKKGENVDTNMIIPELLEIVNRLMPVYDKYIIDEMVKEHGKVVLRMPVSNLRLNPLKLACSSVKNGVRMNSKTPKNDKSVNKLFLERIDNINRDTWKSFFENVVEEENKIWNMDYVVDEMMSEQEP